MARPAKRSLNYSTWDVDVLETDTTIDKLVDAQGPAGFFVYFALCQRAYATEGYYLLFCDGDAATLARKLGGGLNSAQLVGVVDTCCALGLFDAALRERGVLTSAAIQRRYLDGIARRTGVIKINAEYWLLEQKETAGLVFVHKNGVSDHKNPSFEIQKLGSCTVDKIRLDKINPQHNLPRETEVENAPKKAGTATKDDRVRSCTKLLALVQSITGYNRQGDKDLRRMVYALFDRGHSERDVRDAIDAAAEEAERHGLELVPEKVFGPDFWHYMALARQQKEGEACRG